MNFSITHKEDGGYILTGPQGWDGTRHHPNIEKVFRDILLRVEGRIDFNVESYGYVVVLNEPGATATAPIPPDVL